MNYSEGVLYSHLTNPDSLDILAREGFMEPDVRQVIPTEFGRHLVEWALRLFFEAGRTVAPSKEAIVETFSNELEAAKIEINDEVETDSIQWAIEAMRAHWTKQTYGQFAIASSTRVAEAEQVALPAVMHAEAHAMMKMARAVSTRKYELVGEHGVDDAIRRYEERAADGKTLAGLTFGMDEIDQHMLGVHPGEVATLAAGSGIGKSWFGGWVCLQEWRNGRKCLLATLENDIWMTFDRLVCMAARVPYELWQRGELDQVDRMAVDRFREEMRDSPNQPVIAQLSAAESTPLGIVRRAQLEDANSLVVDQISHVRPDDDQHRSMRSGGKRSGRFDQLQDIMRSFKELVRDEYQIPLLLLNQINREGIKAARSTGRFFMEHLAEGAAVGNYSDFVWALFQSELMRGEQVAQFQQLKGRRTTLKHFAVNWRPEIGDLRVKRDITEELERSA